MYWFTKSRRLSILTRAGPPLLQGKPSPDLTSSPFALGSPSLLEEFFSETQSELLHQEEGPTHSPNVPPSPQEILSLEPAGATEPSAASSPRCTAINLA